MNPLARKLMNLAVAAHVTLYRVTGGTIGNSARSMRIILLTTTGRKSGRPRTVPLVHIRDGATYVVAASAGGAPKHPAWYLNLRDDANVVVQDGSAIFPATTRTAAGSERQRLWSALNEAGPFFEQNYQKKTDRQIPIVVLEPQRSEPDGGGNHD